MAKVKSEIALSDKRLTQASKNVLMVGGKGYEMEYDQSQLHLANSSKGM